VTRLLLPASYAPRVPDRARMLSNNGISARCRRRVCTTFDGAAKAETVWTRRILVNQYVLPHKSIDFIVQGI